MEFCKTTIARYADLTDNEIVSAITNEKHDQEAVGYLLWYRYAPLVRRHYYNIIKHPNFFDDAVTDLHIYLIGDDGKCEKFSAFEWRSSLGSWLNVIIWRQFNAYRKKMEEELGPDDGGSEPPAVDDYYERNYMKVILMEAIAKLKDVDQKFVVTQRLAGFNSREIASQMEMMWKKHGIVRKDAKGNIITPSVGYVDVRMQRAKVELKKLLVSID